MALTPQLTATGATSTQTSAYFNRQKGADSGLITFDVTAGTSLDVTVRLEALAGNDDWIVWAQDDTALTGISAREVLISPLTQTDIGPGVNNNFVAPLPETMRFVVAHGNANAATYTVTMDFF